MKFDIYVQPGAKKSCYVGIHDNRPKIKIAAIASDNAANIELCNFFAKILNIPKSKISIFKGHTSRLKTINIDYNISEEEILQKLIN